MKYKPLSREETITAWQYTHPKHDFNDPNMPIDWQVRLIWQARYAIALAEAAAIVLRDGFGGMVELQDALDAYRGDL